MVSTRKEQADLMREVELAKTKVTIGKLYCHYKSKDNTYRVLGFGFLETNNELCVIYQAQYGERVTFLRPLTVWLESVESEGKLGPRFSEA